MDENKELQETTQETIKEENPILSTEFSPSFKPVRAQSTC